MEFVQKSPVQMEEILPPMETPILKKSLQKDNKKEKSNTQSEMAWGDLVSMEVDLVKTASC